ncbi:hypothetical protein C6497_13885 [Candidatus Poribacteria bacterium]|nr:MAG: hypothetical protein C6497_13885 [Candidatus Poribacteria bacterium]
MGQTISRNNTNRFYSHIIGSGNRLIKQDVEKYGRDAFTLDILYQDITPELLDKYEIQAIKSYNTLAPNGYNLTHVGLGGNPSAETRRKKSEAQSKAQKIKKKKSPDSKDRIATSLKALLERNSITRYELAKNLDVSEYQIGRICNAIYVPSLDLLEDLADYFNVTTDHILGRK